MKQTELGKQPRLCLLLYYCIAGLNTYNLYKKLRKDQRQYTPLIIALVKCRVYRVTSKTTQRRPALKNKTTKNMKHRGVCLEFKHWQVKKIRSLEPLVLSHSQMSETWVPVRYFVSTQTKTYKQKFKVVMSSEMTQRLGKWLLCQRIWVQFPKQPHGISHPSVSPFQGDPVPSSGFSRYQEMSCCTDIEPKQPYTYNY